MAVLERPHPPMTKTAFWHLSCENGRQRWLFNDSFYKEQYTGNEQNPDTKFLKWIEEAFLFNKKDNPNSGDKIYRASTERSNMERPAQPNWFNQSSNFSSSLEKKAHHAAYKGIKYYEQLQASDGHWPGDYGGPLFLLPALIIVAHVTNTPFSAVKNKLMQCYMLNHQNDDGGWGLHIEGSSTMFGTVLQYCALRILGYDAGSDRLILAQKWIKDHGGAVGIPSWGKFFLGVMGVYDWSGCNSLLPEMWLLPKWIPIHPWRYWCHARMVYLPMSYCYGNRVTPKIDDLTLALRRELYIEDYANIKWTRYRNVTCDTDKFSQVSPILKLALKGINLLVKIVPKWLRRKSSDYTLSYIDAEDQQTCFIDIGPVNQIINSLCTYHAYGANSTAFKQHVERWDDYLWLAEDGMKMNGYNGSQLWDTAFATQSLLEYPSDFVSPTTVKRAYQYIDQSQIKVEVPDRKKFYRHQSVGGWPFSTLEHGWPISDCTAEGLKAVINCHNSEFEIDIENKIDQTRLQHAVDVILSLQNGDGGWATYELTRSSSFLELLNPSEVFGKIMIDYSWVECTSACVTALTTYHKADDYRSHDISKAIASGISFIKSNQLINGSWKGSWGVCFTYGTWFGIEALSAQGDHYNSSDHVKNACEFLISKQRQDGGWGESHLSCVNGQYEEHDNSQVVNTAWALLSLMAAKYPDSAPIKSGIEFLIDRQLESGDWNQEAISGVFNQNCMITYTSYRNVFPIWALGRYLKNFSNQLNYRGSNHLKTGQG